MKYFIVTFGCAANKSDSERIAGMLKKQGMRKTETIDEADYIVVNTCMVRQSAEDRVYGLVNNLSLLKIKNRLPAGKAGKLKIVLTGCLVGMAVKDRTGKMLEYLRKRMPFVDEFLPVEEVGFNHEALRIDKNSALVPISSGCNNFCTFCVVPYTRGREVSRPFMKIIAECEDLLKKGYREITLIGQNVNSYGADIKGVIVNTVMVKHLGRYRISTLFPYLLEKVAKLGFEKIDFISSNPWDFSEELIEIIFQNPKITRTIHLPVQSGNDEILRKMNRWYTAREYLDLIGRIKRKIPEAKFTTDIIVGFPEETEKQFADTVSLCKKVGFVKAYIALYSGRPMTRAHQIFKDNVPYQEKKRRWKILEELINKPNLHRKR